MAAALAGCLLAGCSPAFAGFPLGGWEEIVFVCEEDSGMTQEDAGATGANGESSAAESASVEKPAEEPVEESMTRAANASKAVSDGKVNLNQAGVEELMTLNGIGETRAKAIIDYRSTQGEFTCIEDIMKIPGIKEGIFEKIKDQIKVR